MKKFILCIIGIGLLIYLLPFMLRGNLDILNPLAEEKNVYAVVEGRYVYSYKAISEKDIPEKIRGKLKIEIK
ncbi:hypothetical protein PDJ99_12155 [Bacillus cereus]|nr:hypothetical protein [Bacillus cereus]